MLPTCNNIYSHHLQPPVSIRPASTHIRPLISLPSIPDCYITQQGIPAAGIRIGVDGRNSVV